jgi:sulfoxide reductase heme-binding subunit YedZ
VGVAEVGARARNRPARRTSSGFRISWPKSAVFVAALLPLAWIAWKFAHDKLGANPIRELEIETGLWTLRLLAVTLSITPIRKAFGWNFLVKYRRMLGLFTFSYATIHLLMWAGVDWFFAWGDMGHEIAKHRYILVGMLTWLIMVPLAITSTKGWVRRLGKRWTALHRLIYAAAITGTIHYLWAVKKDTFFPVVYLAVFALLLGYRVIAARQRAAVRGRGAGS